MLPGEKSEDVKRKIEQGDHCFHNSIIQSGHLSSKLHTAGLQLLLAKGADRSSKIIRRKTIAKDGGCSRGQEGKLSKEKKRKSGKQLTIQTAFAANKFFYQTLNQMITTLNNHCFNTTELNCELF